MIKKLIKRFNRLFPKPPVKMTDREIVLNILTHGLMTLREDKKEIKNGSL